MKFVYLHLSTAATSSSSRRLSSIPIQATYASSWSMRVEEISLNRLTLILKAVVDLRKVKSGKPYLISVEDLNLSTIKKLCIAILNPPIFLSVKTVNIKLEI